MTILCSAIWSEYLQVLNIESCALITDIVLEYVGNHCYLLEKIYVGNVPFGADISGTVKALAKGCPRLTTACVI